MNNSILSLTPAPVWKHFYELTQIPRPSGHCEAITAYIENFGKSLGLETIRDAANNICIRKPATPGYEKKPTIILQSHLDMVPQANSDLNFDFTKDPIEAYIEDEWVKAKGTTLGADNGIGVAATLAVLESNELKHGPIEGLFTVDEETGMFGAIAVRPGFINGKIMLNLDSELDGELYIGCAGGADVTARFQYEEETWIPQEDAAVKVSLTGLKGGHSGVDIHLGRANANKLIFRFLKEALETYDVRLSSISGGTLRNAIPREAFAVIVVDGKEKYERILEMVAAYEELFNKEFAGIENKIDFKAEFIENTSEIKLIPKHIQTQLTHAIIACPNGVINMFAEIPNTVETSINTAVVLSNNGLTEIRFLARSSSESKKRTICGSIESIFKLANADSVETSNSYPGWDPNPQSAILATMEKAYEKQHGQKPKVEVMHAGLECGIILSNVPGLDTVSFGPTIKYPHSPDEKVEIVSVRRFWNYLVEILKSDHTMKTALVGALGLATVLSACSKKQPEQPVQEQLFVHTTDVGNPALKGSLSFDNQTGVYTLTGGGENMWYGSDEFFFVYDQLEGDFSLSTKIAFEGEGTNPHRKMGLIIRESLDNNAKYVDIAVHYGDGLTALQYRTAVGGDTEHIPFETLSADFLILERKGDCIIAKVGKGDSPELLTTEFNIELPATCYVGLFICSHEANIVETGHFSEVKLVK